MDDGADLKQDDPAGQFAVWVLARASSLRVVLSGELDLDEVPTLYREVQRILGTWPSPAEVKFDLRLLRFVDVAGLRALAEVSGDLDDASGRFTAMAVPRHVRRAIAVTGVEAPALISPRQEDCFGSVELTEAGRAKRSRTAVPPLSDRSSTKSQS